MTAKARRVREKNREASAAKVLEAARCTHMTSYETLLPYQWVGLNLVHRVVRDKRMIFVNEQHRWRTRNVWATVCNHVIAIDLSKFISTSKAPTCVRCIVGPNFPSIGLRELLFPWDGSTPNVV